MGADAVSIGANTFQFFTRNPRGGKVKPLNLDDISLFRDFAAQQGIERILAHAPYTLNPASSKPTTREFALMVLADDLARMEYMPGQMYNLHPGSALDQPISVAIDRIAEALNFTLKPSQTTMVLLETMAGKGSEVGRSFEDLASIIERLDCPEHVGVCLDTCHVWDAGYDIASNLEGVLFEFDRVIGLNRLRAIHLNDSRNVCGSRKDRHARIGEGKIGFEALTAIVNHPQLCHLPFYLETPNPDLSGFAQEIALLRVARTR